MRPSSYVRTADGDRALEGPRVHKEGPASPIEDFKSWRLRRAGMPNTEWGKILRETGEDRSNQKGCCLEKGREPSGAGLQHSVEWGSIRRTDNKACDNGIIKPVILYANLKN